MRSIWNGSITFGLITIPVKLYSAVGDRDVDLHLLHEKDNERIHYKRVCDKGHEVDWDDIVKGYEYEKGRWVTLTDEELEALDADSVRAIDVVNFVPLEEIDPIYYDRTYYIAPQEAGLKAYRLLVEALDKEKLVGVAKVALREKEHLAAIRLKDDLLLLETMHWPDEIRAADFEQFEKKTKLRDNEVKMARRLVQQLAGDFDPTEFEDEYRAALETLIDKKIEGEEIVMPEPKEQPEQVIDLMDALKASVENAKKKSRKPKRKAG